ncbi:MAG: right-handed parallel beta-helix repeat-containing protein [Verrucomicrobiales bacterium]|nr:right-handed parallel beta-helix repeat-containing protein [Verrucomicrobiales bacterium]
MSDVRQFGAKGDGITDDTAALRHAVESGDGVLFFPAGRYVISGTVKVPVPSRGPCAISGEEGASTVVMSGQGPAFQLIGTHAGTGDPGSVQPGVWQDERMPTVQNIVLDGKHPGADGLQLVETMQARIEGVMVRRMRHGIHLIKRNRNVIISNCHLYHNTGSGLYLDRVNLHQINVSSSHISYNRLGGIRIERSEVRNLQITGNDIEYNNAKSHGELPSEPTAEIWIDATEPKASVNEITIASNTIQATDSRGGANIRILEKADTSRPPGLVAISGNVIGSQENNVHLSGVYGVTISGNTIYSCARRNLLVEDSRLVTIGSNHFRRHTSSMGTGVRLTGSSDCTISGCTFRDESKEGQASGASLLELEGCRRVAVSGCVFADGVPYGVDAENCSDVRITGCIISGESKARGALRFHGNGKRNGVASNNLLGSIEISPQAGVSLHENIN